MTEMKIVDGIHLKKAGIFDMDKLYSFVYSWLDEKKYYYHEGLYKKKGDELELEMGGFRKVTDYAKYQIDITFHLWSMVDVEMIKHGKKVKMTKAWMDITITGKLVTDYEGRWSKSKFLESLNKFYENYIIKRTIEDEWAVGVYKEAYDLHEKMKAIMEQEASRNG